MTDRLVVVGAGTMGIGIAYVAASRRYDVELVETDADQARRATRRLRELWDKAVAAGRTRAEEAVAARERVRVVESLGSVGHEPAVLLEAVPERSDLKRTVLGSAKRLAPRLLASNFQQRHRPDRVEEMQVGPSTSDEAQAMAPADIDRAMTLGYRHPMGPLELTDVVGLDVRLDIAKTLRGAYGDRFAPPALLESMVADGRLGKKSGGGFYTWMDGVKQ